MLNLSLKVGNSNLFFAGKVNTLPVSQKTAVILPSFSTDIFEKKSENTTEIQKQLEKTNIFSIIENETQYSKYFPTLSNLKQFPKDTYLKTSKQEIKLANIIAGKNNAYMQQIQSAEKISEGIKQNLDTLYGENNYSVLGIGRSVSLVTELLKLNGVKSNSVPFTYGLVKRNPKYNDVNVLLKELDWKKYFAQFGFDEKALTDKKKTTIVTDFVYTGDTIFYFQNLMNTLYPHNNIKYIDILDLAKNMPENIQQKNKISSNDTKRFILGMEECDYKNIFSTCQHLWDIKDYKNYKMCEYKYPLLTKIILLNYLDKKFSQTSFS